MKKVILFSVIALIIMAFTGFVANATNKTQEVVTESCSNDSLIVKQTITFQNSSELVIYYSKIGSEYKVYSETDLSRQSPKKLQTVTNSTFEFVSEVKGTCYVNCKSIKEVLNLGSDLYNKYGHYLNPDNIEINIKQVENPCLF